MREVILYDRFFRKEDREVPYENTKAYVEDLFCVLDGLIQAAFAVSSKEDEKIDHLTSDVLKMAEQISVRRQKSSNCLIWMEELFSLTQFERFLLILSISIYKNPVYTSYYSSLLHNSNVMYPTKGVALILYGLVENPDDREKEGLIWDKNHLARFFLDLEQSRHSFADILCPVEGLPQYILYGGERYLFQEEFNQLIYPKQMNLLKERQQKVQEQLFRFYEKTDLGNRMVQINGKRGSGKKNIVGCFAWSIKKRVLFISTDQFFELSKQKSMDTLNKLYANAQIMDAIPCFLVDEKSSKELPYILTKAEQMFSFCIVLTEEGIKQVNAEIFKAYRLGQQSRLNQIATRIDASYTWEDLIVCASLKKQLTRLSGQIRFQEVVEEQWGFIEKLPYGKGISVMFGGPPGTGKTMAAQIMANELEMELYRIDLSMVYNKYIGETEKNISELFENAKNMNAILFFDEADALFAKRSDVKSSNDRNANGVTAHLLQKMEDYDGVVILATNLPQSLDDAFRRRIKFIIQFDYPDEALRLKLYQTILPKKAVCGEVLDFAYYARHFEMSGSSIKEVLVNAAYIAAEEGGGGIRNKHLIEAICQNYSKYGKVLTKEEFGYLSHL